MELASDLDPDPHYTVCGSETLLRSSIFIFTNPSHQGPDEPVIKHFYFCFIFHCIISRQMEKIPTLGVCGTRRVRMFFRLSGPSFCKTRTYSHIPITQPQALPVSSIISNSSHVYSGDWFVFNQCTVTVLSMS